MRCSPGTLLEVVVTVTRRRESILAVAGASLTGSCDTHLRSVDYRDRSARLAEMFTRFPRFRFEFGMVAVKAWHGGYYTNYNLYSHFAGQCRHLDRMECGKLQTNDLISLLDRDHFYR